MLVARVVPSHERFQRVIIRRRGAQLAAEFVGRRLGLFRRDQAEAPGDRQDDHRADDQDFRMFHNVLHGTARASYAS